MDRHPYSAKWMMLVGLAATLLCAPRLADARITRIEITQTESPTFGGASFGTVGQYEKLVGRAFGEIDPRDRRDPMTQVITDLDLAPRNASGMVEYDTGIIILRPIDPSKANRRMFYELTNRGVILTLRVFNESPNASTTNPAPADAGNGFLMRQGYTLLYTGWDVSAVGTFTSNYPIATQRDGSPIVGPSAGTMLIAPGGKPTSSASSASRSTESGVCGSGLRTTAQPAASAGASFHVAIRNG